MMEETITLAKFAFITSNLKVLARLQAGDKLIVESGMLDIQPSGLFTSFTRRIGGQTRTESLEVVKNVIMSAIELIELIAESKYLGNGSTIGKKRMDELEWLMSYMSKTATGLTCLMTTYGEDAEMIRNLDKLLSALNSCLAKHAQFILDSVGNIELDGKKASEFIV